LLILQDSKVDEDLAGFLASGASAESAVLRTLEKYTRAFEQLSNDYFRERLYDIKDVFRRILWHLRPIATDPATHEQRLVLVGEEASVADLFSVELERLAAVVVEQGGRTSHAAILARTLGIPMVAQVADLARKIHTGTPLLVDGDRGQVHVQPTAAMLAEHRTGHVTRVTVHGAALPAGLLPTEMPGGKKVPLIYANVNLISEVRPAVDRGAMGVGLYRTEFLILSRRMMISEEQQVVNYRQVIGLLERRPVNIRTFDLRAEKSPPPSAEQPDPGRLDWRLVLRSPAAQRVFREQVRAILRAGIAGHVRILVPLVVSTEQLHWVKGAVAEAQESLRRDGLPFAENVPLGIMIEVPAAATLVEEWTGHVDFLCVGTNDLLASAMGVSRDDPVSEIVCDPLHPALQRTVAHIVAAGRAANIPVTMCGEMASTAEGVRLLADLGVDALSVAVNHLPTVHATLRHWATSSR
jgi:phosphoenolpyruvate-protein kinase (PTS system EI component)